MATPVINLRLPATLIALLDAKCDATSRTRTDVIKEALIRMLAPDLEDVPRRTATEKAALRPAPAKLPPVVTAATLARGERDLAPKLAEADSRGDGRGAGIVSGLDVPLGNQRRPYQKGQGAAAKGKR